MLFEGTPERKWRDDEKRVSKMVFIGRELDRETFEEVRLAWARWCALGFVTAPCVGGNSCFPVTADVSLQASYPCLKADAIHCNYAPTPAAPGLQQLPRRRGQDPGGHPHPRRRRQQLDCCTRAAPGRYQRRSLRPPGLAARPRTPSLKRAGMVAARGRLKQAMPLWRLLQDKSSVRPAARRSYSRGAGAGPANDSNPV